MHSRCPAPFLAHSATPRIASAAKALDFGDMADRKDPC